MSSSKILRPDIAEGRLGGFLHDLAQLPGQGEVALAVDLRRLERQELAAELGPGHADGDPDLVLLVERRAAELGDAEIGLEVLRP